MKRKRKWLTVRKKRILKRKALLYGSLSFVVLAFSFFVWASFQFVNVHNIQVEGSSAEQNFKVRKFLHNSIFKTQRQLFSPFNHLLIDKEKLAAEVLFAYPELEKVSFANVFESPNTIKAKVQAREPHYLWCQNDKKETCFWADKKGFIFSKANISAKESAFFKIYSKTFDSKQILIAEKPLRTKILNEDLQIIEHLKKELETLKLKIQEINFKSDNEIIALAYTNGNHKLKLLFRKQKINEQTQNLYTVIHNALKEKLNKIEYIDLRFDNKIFYKDLKESENESR